MTRRIAAGLRHDCLHFSHDTCTNILLEQSDSTTSMFEIFVGKSIWAGITDLALVDWFLLHCNGTRQSNITGHSSHSVIYLKMLTRRLRARGLFVRKYSTERDFSEDMPSLPGGLMTSYVQRLAALSYRTKHKQCIRIL